jgi:hypothetical protein
LGQLLDSYAAERSGARDALATALAKSAGFSGPVLREGLRRGFAPWTSGALRALAEQELGMLGERESARGTPGAERLHVGFACSSVFLAGAIPMPALLEITAALAARTPLLLKTGGGDRASAHHFAATLANIDAELSRCLRVVDFAGEDAECARAACEADCVVAIGSDASVGRVRDLAAGAERFVAHGHRLSVCALGHEALATSAVAKWAERIALDIALWDQLGCLSPVAIYAVNGDSGATSRLAEALARALEDAEALLPRGAVPASALALASNELAEAELRAAGGAAVEVFRGSGSRYAVVREADAEWRPAPLHRFVRVHPVADAQQLAAALTPLARHLAAVACTGFGRDERAVAERLLALGASRVCRPGELQSPPLAWPRDGLPVLLRYARDASIETAQ